MSDKKIADKVKTKIKTEEEFDIKEIYTPLSVAKKEIWRRWNDKKLRKKVEDFLGGDIPKIFKNKPTAVFSRYITTPNFEFYNFLDLAELSGLEPSCLEYANDKFVAKNSAKYYLCKMFFLEGEGKNGGKKISKINLVNFNKSEGHKLCDIKTITGGKLVDFHHKILSKVLSEKINPKICDFSDWFKKHRNKTKYYYLYYFALFIRNGILFENFLMDKEEESFTKNKVLPSFKKIEKIFGVRPLIVPLDSFKSEADHCWYYYSEKLKKQIESSRIISNQYAVKKDRRNQSPKLKVKDTKKYGLGVYADESIKKGKIIRVLKGEVISFDECIRRIEAGEEQQSDSLQIGLETDIELDNFSRIFNHSCDPTAGIRKVSELFAIRDIKKGEEITYDYSSTIGPNIAASLWTMKCRCGSKKCRKAIGNILSIPETQLNQYKKNGALQDYILTELRRIKKNKKGKYILPKYKKIIINTKKNGL